MAVVVEVEGVVGKGEYDVYGESNGLGKYGAVWRGGVGAVVETCGRRRRRLSLSTRWSGEVLIFIQS